MEAKEIATILKLQTMGYVINDLTINVPPARGAVAVIDDVRYMLYLGYKVVDKLNILGLEKRKCGRKRKV